MWLTHGRALRSRGRWGKVFSRNEAYHIGIASSIAGRSITMLLVGRVYAWDGSLEVPNVYDNHSLRKTARSELESFWGSGDGRVE